MGQLDTAQQIAGDILLRARETGRTSHEAIALVLVADIEQARNDRHAALSTLEQAIALADAGGLTRLVLRHFNYET